MSGSSLSERAKLWSTPSALQLPANHARSQAWLEPWIELEEHIETVGPDRKVVVYAAPRELRPLTVQPVVRWMSWPEARRSDLEHGPNPEIRHYPLCEPFDEIEAAARGLNEALRRFPYVVDALDSNVDIELPPQARTWRCVRADTRLTHVELCWTVGEVSELDSAWGVLWDCIASNVEGRDALVGWRELYGAATGPDAARADV